MTCAVNILITHKKNAKETLSVASYEFRVRFGSTQTLASEKKWQLSDNVRFVLQSTQEQKYWLTQYTRHLAEESNVMKLREVLNFLMSKNGSTDCETFSTADLNAEDKSDILKEVMTFLGKSLDLQRLYMEYKEQMDTKTSVSEVTGDFLASYTSA